MSGGAKIGGCSGMGPPTIVDNPLFTTFCSPFRAGDVRKRQIFSGTATRYLAEKTLRTPANGSARSMSRFSDREFQPSFEETVRGELVFIVQSTFPPTDNLFELLLMVDAARRASAKRIVAATPIWFARQDRKDKPRVSIGAWWWPTCSLRRAWTGS